MNQTETTQPKRRGRPPKTESINKALLTTDKPQRFAYGEVGYTGANLYNGVSQDELYRELIFPQSLKTFKKMQYHSAISSCLSLYDNVISKVIWNVKPPKDATERELQETKFIEECLHDMDIPLRQVVKDALSSNVYGFALLEKVFKVRSSGNSYYNDGKYGIKKLALIHQETVKRFLTSEDGSDVIGVEQDLSGWNTLYRKPLNNPKLPRSKYVHIVTGRSRNDPYGKSPLRDVFIAWKFLAVIEELEAQSVAKDMSNMPLLRIPSQFMSPDASPEQKLQYEAFKNIIRNVNVNQQSGIVLPSDVNPETRSKLFEFELIKANSQGKAIDTEPIKQYYLNQIYTAMSADVLILGQGGGGSYALGAIKNSLTSAAIESMLDNIVEAFNRDLIQHLYKLNGFNPARACSLDYENLHEVDLDVISRFIQRTKAVSALPMTHEVVNYVLGTIGLDPISKDTDLQPLLGEPTSRSGDSFNTSSGGLNGTAESVSEQDNSSANLENS